MGGAVVTIYGIDVSYHQGPIDWARVAGDGISFATIKATSGESSGGADSPAYFRAQAPAMARHVPLCGGYHWLKPVWQTSAARQVQTFLDVLDSGLGGYRGRLVQLDVEEGAPADVRAWMAEWNRRTDHYPVALYLPDWLENQWPGNQLGAFAAAAWWSSEYVAGSTLGYRVLANNVQDTHWHAQDGVKPAILQYTSKARVAGVTGNCDVNIYRGTLAQLAALLTEGDDDMEPTTALVKAPDVDGPEFLPDGFSRPFNWWVSANYLHTLQAERAALRCELLLKQIATAQGLQYEALLAEVDQVEELAGAIQAGDPAVLAEKLSAKLGDRLTPQLLDALSARLAS